MGQIAGLAGQTEGKVSLIARDIHKFITFISIVAITIGARSCGQGQGWGGGGWGGAGGEGGRG